MRVTFILPVAGLHGGVRVVADYAEYLAKRGHEVVVISCRPGPRNRLTRLIRRMGWTLGHDADHPPSHLMNRGLDWRIVDDLATLEARDVPDADILVATFWTTAERVVGLPDSKGQKVYFCQHFEAFDYFPVHRVRQTYVDMPHQICVSEWVKSRIREVAPDSKQIVVPNGVDSKFSFVPPPENLQRALRVGFMWAPAHWKGADLAIAAAERLRDKLPGLEVVAFGSTASAIHDLEAAGIRFILRPSEQEIPSIYGQCKVWIFPSRLEGYGLPLLEAMACGTPVAGFDAGAASMLLPEGGGLLVNERSSERLADAAEALLRLDPADWTRRSLAARAMAEQHELANAAARFEGALLEMRGQ